MEDFFDEMNKKILNNSEDEVSDPDGSTYTDDESVDSEPNDSQTQEKNISIEKNKEGIKKSSDQVVKNTMKEALKCKEKFPNTSLTVSQNNISDVPSTSAGNYTGVIRELIKNELSAILEVFTNHVDQKINDVKEHVNLKLQEVSSSINNRINVKRKITPPKCFPIKTMEEFEEFEKCEETQTEAREYFILWGGEDLKTATRRFLKEALADDLAMSFKYYSDKENSDASGRKHKILFGTKLNEVMCHACLVTFEKVTVDKFTTEMQNALRASKQRARDKKNHLKKKQVEEESEDRLQHLRNLENQIRNQN